MQVVVQLDQVASSGKGGGKGIWQYSERTAVGSIGFGKFRATIVEGGPYSCCIGIELMYLIAFRSCFAVVCGALLLFVSPVSMTVKYVR